MAAFDYSTKAQLFPAGGAAATLPARTRRGRLPVGYGRFARAADAIRFAIEELPPNLLVGACLEAGEKTFDGDGILRLYESADYPLARRVASGLAYARNQ